MQQNIAHKATATLAVDPTRKLIRGYYIPWNEALLFAVIAENQNTLVYELASSTGIIRWASQPAISYADAFPACTVGTAPLGLIQAASTTEEYQWQVRQLVVLVASKTGLPLYDLC